MIDTTILEIDIPTYREFLPTIRPSDGRQQGQPLSVDGHPAQSAIIDALDSGKWKKFAWAKPVQDGGTLLGLVPMLRRSALERQRVVLAYPTWAAAKDIWQTKIWPVLEALGGQQPIKGAGSRGGAAQRLVALPGGGLFMLRAAGGRGESGQASITGDCLLVDEVDDWPSMHRLELIAQRINESIDPLAVYCCTVKKDEPVGSDGASNILSMVASGTDCRLQYPCHQCGQLFPLAWECINTKHAVYICPGCGAEWTERQRLDALRAYQVTMKNPTADLWSILWTSLDSPRITMAKLVKIYEDALAFIEKSNHGPMRSFYRDRLTRGYLGDKNDGESQDLTLTPEYLARRSELYGWSETTLMHEDGGGTSVHQANEAPNLLGRSVMVAAIDVQGNRIYWSAGIIDSKLRTYDYAWGYRHGNPEREPWRPGELAATLQRQTEYIFSMASTLGMHFAQGVVDVGFLPEDVASWLIGQTHWRGIAGFDRLPTATAEVAVQGALVWQPKFRDGLGCWQVCNGEKVATARLALHQAYKIDPASGGAAILPSGLRSSDAYLRHLTASRYESDKHGKMGWKRVQVRNDHLDCRVYWTTVGSYLMSKYCEAVDRLPPVERQAADTAAIIETRQQQHQPEPVDSGYDLGTMG